MGYWALGVVVRQWYQEPGWTDEKVSPYQVKLDDGMTIYVPSDQDKAIRAAQGIHAYGKIPVTVLTGFLGSGKTTLLNHILETQHGKRYAVIENEFGEVPIDEMLLDRDVGKKNTMESVTVLDNGCLCCTLRDDLVIALREIVRTVEERVDRGAPNAMIDGIIIETTGMADPGPICKTFSSDPVVQRHCKIDGVLTIVDGRHFLEQLDRERSPDAVNESAQQVAFADKILINKVDLIDERLLEETTAAIRGVNTLAPIRTCSLSKKPDEIPISELLAIDAFDTTKLLEDGKDLDDLINPKGEGHGHSHSEHGHSGHSDSEDCVDPECSDDSHSHGRSHSHGHSHGHGHSHASDCADPECTDESHGHGGHGDSHSHSHGESRHDTDIGTMVLEMDGSALDVNKFNVFLQKLLVTNSVNLYRYKGVLAVEQKGHTVRYVLQGVHDMMEVSFSGPWPDNRPVKTQVVLIGRKLDKDDIYEKFSKTVAGEVVVA